MRRTFTVEDRADRWLRRHRGPWQTAERRAGPIVATSRHRYAPKVEYVRLWVALHDLQRAILSEVAPVAAWCVRHPIPVAIALLVLAAFVVIVGPAKQ